MNPILTVIITKDRPTEIQTAVYPLLGEPTDVAVIGKPVPDRLWQDAGRMFGNHHQMLYVIDELTDLADRNFGIGLAEQFGYPYTFFMDDDNVVPSGYLGTLLLYLESTDDAAAVSGVIQTYASVKEEKYKHWKDGPSGEWPWSHGQRLIVEANSLCFTERIQVMPYSVAPREVEVEYFVNSWLQRTDAMMGERVVAFGPFGEEIDYTLRLPDRKVVLPHHTMYHLAADEGGTRTVKEQGQDADERAAHWLALAKHWGYDVTGVVEYVPERAK